MRKLLRETTWALAVAAAAAPAAAQEREEGVSAEPTRLLIAPLGMADEPIVVRELRYDAERLAERLGRRAPGAAVPAVSGAAGFAGCVVVDAPTAHALTEEVACGGGDVTDRRADPAQAVEDALAPQVDEGDAVAPRADSDDEDTIDFQGWVNAYRNPSSGAPRDYQLAVVIETDPDFGYVGIDVGGCSNGSCETVGGLSGGESDGGSTPGGDVVVVDEDEQAAIDAAIEEQIVTPEEVLEGLLALSEAEEEAPDEAEAPADDTGDEGETPTDEDPTESPEGYPDPDGFGDVPAECEDALEDRLDPGAADPIDPSPLDDPGGEGGAFLACFGDALVLEVLAGCPQDLAARPTPDGDGSVCASLAERGGALPIAVLTRNDLVTDPSPEDGEVTAPEVGAAPVPSPAPRPPAAVRTVRNTAAPTAPFRRLPLR